MSACHAHERLWDKVAAPARARGLDPRLSLPVSAAAVTLLGVPQPAHRAFLDLMARHQEATRLVRDILGTLEDAQPWLRGHLAPLVGLLGDVDDQAVQHAASEMLFVLADGDLPRLADDPGVAGDVLGLPYTLLTGPADRSARGAFYTPAPLAALMATLVGPRAGESFYEPCVGTGGLAIAAIRAMRAAGKHPELVHWVLGDVDPLALAICGVQICCHGMTCVTLRPGNALTDPLERER